MTTQRRTTAFLTALAVSGLLAACQGNAPKEPTPEPPAGRTVQVEDEPAKEFAATPDGDGIQETGEMNPTGTPVGEAPKAQPIDMAQATSEVPADTPMGTDREQAQEFMKFYKANPDAPRWVITWGNGAGKLDWDKASGVLTRTLPDGTESKYENVNLANIQAVAMGDQPNFSGR